MLRSVVCSFLFLILSKFTHITQAKYAADCLTPNNVDGMCMPYKSCAGAAELLLDVYLNKPNRERAASYLLDAQCDFVDKTPFICCANDQIQMNPDVRAHLEQLDCGSFSTKKIANGEVAKLFDYRWMALLLYKENKDVTCEGSLIDERHILTAAHCLHDFKIPPIAVRLGEYNISSEHDCGMIGRKEKCLGPVEDILIEKIIPHEDYVKGDISHDIAILRLNRNVTFQKHIRPICLPINQQIQENDVYEYLVAGWGLTQCGQTSNVLLWTTVPHRQHEFCQKKLKITLNEKNICAGGENYQDTCKGDSGGPLFQLSPYVNGAFRATQFGIVNGGVKSCGLQNYPAIYTNVTYYLQWITDHIAM